MHSNSIPRHLRELAAAARDLAREDDTHKSTRVMKDLAAHYEDWARSIENTERERRELTTHIEQCRVVWEITENMVCKAVLADLIRYLEGKLKAIAEPEPHHASGETSTQYPFPVTSSHRQSAG
jgi:hypothetical protein